MNSKLGKNVQVGQKILVWGGWEKIIEVNDIGVVTKKGNVKFGEIVGGWKAK